MVMLSDWVADDGLAAESLTCTVKLDVPDAVGAPEISPVLASSESPVGRLPAVMDHE